MKCDKVSFTYSGTYQSAGCLLAKLLSDISVNYESTDGRVTGTADLGALLRDGLLNQRPPQSEPVGVIRDQVAEEASVGMASPVKTPYTRAYAWLRSHGFDPHHISEGGGDNLTMTLAKEFFKDTPPTIQIAVPPAHVRDRNVLQWLRGMNIPIGVPITLQFVADLSRGTGC